MKWNFKRWAKVLMGLVGLELALIYAFLMLVNASYIDTALKNKQYLLEGRPEVIFAGDSRAQRQLVPTVFNAEDPAGRTAVNIAAESADVLALLDLVDQYPGVFAEASLLLSVSANQVNDGAVSGGSFSPAMISRMSVAQQLLWFFPEHLDVLSVYYRRSFKYLRKAWTGRLKAGEEDRATLGFRPIDKQWQVDGFDFQRHISAHPWYRSWRTGGYKQRLFESALLELKAKVGHLAVFSGPIAPSYRQAAAGGELMRNEFDFEDILRQFCREYDIAFHSYVADPRFGDRDFYDPFHLNRGGAETLTRVVSAELL